MKVWPEYNLATVQICCKEITDFDSKHEHCSRHMVLIVEGSSQKMRLRNFGSAQVVSDPEKRTENWSAC